MNSKNNKFSNGNVGDLLKDSIARGKQESKLQHKSSANSDLNSKSNSAVQSKDVNSNNKHTAKPTKKINHPRTNNRHTKGSKDLKPKQNSKNKQDVIENHYGVLPMSCTLDIRTIGKLEAAKQVLGVHNRDAVVEDLINRSLDSLLKPKGSTGKKEYDLYYKVFMMKHKASAEHHYKQFYKNSRKK